VPKRIEGAVADEGGNEAPLQRHRPQAAHPIQRRAAQVAGIFVAEIVNYGGIVN